MSRITFLCFLFATTTAHADGPTAVHATTQPFHDAIAVELATLDNSGGSIEIEHDLGVRKLSVVLALGARIAARGDYDSFTSGAGVEIRRWLRRATTMTGWYVAARTDLARTTVEDTMEDRRIGALATWTTGVSTGYRWVVWKKLELTPSVGAAMVVEGGMNGMSPTTVRGAGVIGLTAGMIF